MHLSSKKLVSKFAFTCNLYRYSESHTKLYTAAPGRAEELVERPKTSTLWGMLTGKTGKHLEVGLYSC